MECMFFECNSLKNIDLSNFNTQNITYMGDMFYECNSLKKNNIKTKDKKILNQLK
jgi:surface protein